MKIRQKRILNHLSVCCSGSLEELAQRFSVTVRTIRNDMDEINSILQSSGKFSSCVQIKQGYYELESQMANELRQLELFDVHENYYFYILTPEQRRMIEKADLLRSHDYLTSEFFAQKFFVNRNVILQDMNSLKEWFSDQGGVLHAKKSFGYKVEMDEVARRKLLSENFRSLNLVMEGDREPINFQNLAFYESFFSTVRVAELLETIQSIVAQYYFELSNIALETLVIHVALAIQRNVARQDGQRDFHFEVDRNSLQYLIAKKIYEAVNHLFQIELPPIEVDYISLHMNGHFIGEQNSGDETGNLHLLIQLMIIRLIRKVGSSCLVDFSADRELYNGLFTHIASSIARYRNRIFMKNPLLDQICSSYPKLFGVVQKHVEELEDFVSNRLSADEIAYLLLYFAAALKRLQLARDDRLRVLLVCASGWGTAQLLREQISRLFRFDIVETVSVWDIPKILEMKEIDLILSTVPLRKDYQMESIEVSALLTEEQIQQITRIASRLSKGKIVHEQAGGGFKAQVQELLWSCSETELRRRLQQLLDQEQRKEVGQSKMLSEVMKTEFIQLDLKAENWQDAIRKTGKVMVENSVCKQRYVEECVEAVHELGPYIVVTKHIAMPHASNKENVRRTAIAFTRLFKPVNFGNKDNDPVHFLFMLATTDANAHLLALQDLMVLLENQDFLNCMAQVEDAEGMIAFIKEFESKKEELR